MTTMRQVALRAGVSAKTVSRVYNDDHSVAEPTRRRVQAALRDLDYAPNLLAKSFRAGKDDAIAVAVPDASDPFFADLVTGVTSVAAQQGALVLVTSFGAGPRGERAALEVLLSRQVAGLITAPVSAEQSYLRALAARTPMVFVDREPRGVQADCFIDDDADGARRAVRHLLDHGHRAIAFVGDDLAVPTTASRWRGYCEELTSAGIPVRRAHRLLGQWSTVTSAGHVLEELLASPAPPTALFSSNARATIGLVNALRNGNHQDLALVSFGDFPLAAALEPALTVIDQDARRLGTLAAERLFARIQHPGRSFSARNVLPLRLIPRGSGELPPRRVPDVLALP